MRVVKIVTKHTYRWAKNNSCRGNYVPYA